MTQRVSSKKIAKNVMLSVVVQAISLAISFILNFIVPKFIDERQYSYWQTFALYMNYVGILHFGILDGIVLRYSQYDYDELDKSKLRSQFQIILFFNTILAVIISIASCIFLNGEYKFVWVLVAVSIVTKNTFSYTSYTFQITNRIKKYALSVIIQNTVFAIGVVILLFLRVNNFYWYCIANLLGDVVAVLVGIKINKELYFGEKVPVKDALKEGGLNINAGIVLMVATISSSLLIGGAKMIVNWHWDSLTFGKVAYSFSATTLFLAFVKAISIVLFPSLKRMEENQLPTLYGNIRKIISPLFFVALACYFPLCKILQLWLPKYEQSLYYMGILLPIIIFSSKVSLLTDNYLKAYRKEKTLFIINIISLLLGIVLFIISAYALNNLDLLLYCVVFIVSFRSILSEIIIMKIIGKNFTKEFIIESVLTIAFILITVKVSGLIKGFIIYFAILCIYLIEEFYKDIYKFIKKKANGKKDEE